ncbi:hypothetical protein, partial [Nocardia abscessus]|uniref:hypothetical protein n=1 Tax=Nocardia abscessus TaxID=120957 RepID=UPI002456623C
TALDAFLRNNNGVWVGWEVVPFFDVESIIEDGLELHPVPLSATEILRLNRLVDSVGPGESVREELRFLGAVLGLLSDSDAEFGLYVRHLTRRPTPGGCAPGFGAGMRYRALSRPARWLLAV